MWARDLWRLCGQILTVPSLSEFPEATSFFVLFRFSWEIQEFLFLLCRYESPRNSHPKLHLVPILENSTLRRDWNLLRQVSLNLTTLSDKVP